MHSPKPISEKPQKTPSPSRKPSALKRISAATLLLLTSCVYHPRRENTGIHPLQIEHMHSRTVFPWRTTEEFKRYFELKIGASIVLWISFPYQLIRGFGELDIKRVLTSPWPPAYEVFDNDRQRIEVAVETEQNLIRMKAREELLRQQELEQEDQRPPQQLSSQKKKSPGIPLADEERSDRSH